MRLYEFKLYHLALCDKQLSAPVNLGFKVPGEIKQKHDEIETLCHRFCYSA